MLPWTSVCLVVAMCVAPLSARADSPPRVLHDATIVTDGTMVRNAEATVFVSVTGATGLTASAPVAGASIEVSLAPPAAVPRAPAPAGSPRLVGQARTGADGTAVVHFRVPPLDPGSYRLLVVTRSPHGSSTTARAVEIADQLHLHLRTDRGVYRAGQTILWRVTAVGGADAHPAAGEEVELVVRDPRDTAIWRGRQAIPASGMVAGSIPLADDLLTGGYALTARVRGNEQTERVEVREFRLPAYELRVERVDERPIDPGSSFTARVTARYRYGEPVGGQVDLSLDADGRPDDGAAATGRLDASGVFIASLRVPPRAAGAIAIHATVTDGAGRRERAELSVPLRVDDDLRLALVPERATMTPGALHWFTALTTDGRGHMIPARVHLRAERGRRLSFDSPGALRIALRAPDATSWTLRASAMAAGGDVDEKEVSVPLGPGPVLRLRDAVVAAGAPVVVTGSWDRPRGAVLATLLRDGAPIASTLARIDRAGSLRAELRPPPGSFGLATVRLVEVGWDPSRTGATRDGQHLNVYLRPARLDVAIAAETRHRPGQRASLEVAVRDAAGRPVPGAALAASVVDERVLALGQPRPDLADALQRIDRVEDGTALGLVFADLLAAGSAAGATRPAPTPVAGASTDAALRAILEALPPEQHRPELVVPAEQRWERESARIVRAREKAIARLVATPGAIGRPGARGAWHYHRELWQLLAEAGWSEADRATPWREPTTWTYAVILDPGLAFDQLAPEIADRRLDQLAEALRRRPARARRLLGERGTDALRALVASGDIESCLAADSWGTSIHVERQGAWFLPRLPDAAIDLVSAGPDRVFATADDRRLEDIFPTGGGIGWGSSGYGAGGGGIGFGSASVLGGARIGARREEPLVRRRFDETVLWQVGVVTDGRGGARLDVPLGDSITGWRVAVEALSRAGAVGSAETRLETFLPLHLDAELPARLAAGDKYRIPIAIANHSGRAQRLTVIVDIGGALRWLDDGPLEIDLAAGETGVVHTRAAAVTAGVGRVRLELRAGRAAVDLVDRSIPIDPPGEVIRGLHTGEVDDGAGRLRFEVPPGAAAGSLRARLRLFRGAADLAVDGLEGMLQEPNGCFEQTSSTTYPNLLVLRLIKDTPRMARVRDRARELVGRGYQRLLAYEVTGGGFSWFGEEPANQVLTAYGLTEFVDMAAVYPVDPVLIARTRAWLLGKQQRDGSWRPDAAFLHDWSQVQGRVSTTAFIAWALAEAGARGRPLERALGFLRAHRASVARDPYLVALWAAAEGAAHGARNPALALLVRAGEEGPSGLVFRARGRTIFHASGRDADAQLTALAVTALARAGRQREAQRALDWLWQARSDNYGWGTTQGTVLALRAAAVAAPPAPSETGTLRVRVDGRGAGTIDLASIDVPQLSLSGLAPGPHQLTVDGDARGRLRADLRLSWREPRAAQAASAGLDVSLNAPSVVALGGAATLTARLTNRSRAAVAMPTAVLPVPPGFAADPASLAALRRARGVSRVEDHGDSLAVYLLDLGPGQTVDLAYRLDAEAVCDVLVRPASAYAFYTPSVRGSSAARRLRVSAGRAATRPTALP